MQRYLQRKGYSPEEIKSLLHPEEQAALQRSQAELERIAAQTAEEQEYKKQPWYGGFLETIGKPLEWLHEKVEEPWGAAVSGGLATLLPGRQDWLGESAMREAQARGGMSWLESAKVGYRELPGLQRMGTELSFPLWWVPGMFAAKPLALAGRSLAGTRGLGGVGKGMQLGARGILGTERAVTYPIAKPLEKFFPTRFPAPAKPKAQVEKWMRPRARPQTPEEIVAHLKDPNTRILEVQSTGEMILENLKPDTFRKIAQMGGEYPGTKQIVKTLAGPVALVGSDDAVGIAYMAKNLTSERLMNQSHVLMAEVRAVGDPMLIFNIDERALALAVEPIAGKPLSNGIYDIIDFPHLFKLTDEQRLMVDALRSANEKIDRLLSREGLRPPAYESGGTMFHRMVRGIEVEEGRIVERPLGGLRGKAGQLPRKHVMQTEGMEKRVVYEQNPLRALQERLGASGTLVANERMVQVLGPLWRTAKDIVPQALYLEASMAKSSLRNQRKILGAINRLSWARSTAKLPGATMAMIERESPEVAKAIRAAYDLPLLSRKQLEKGIRQDLLKMQRSVGDEISAIERQLSTTKGEARKALEITQEGLKAENEIIGILAGKGKTAEKIVALEENLAEIQMVLGARATPYGKDLARMPFHGVPNRALDAREQVYRRYLEDLSRTPAAGARTKSEALKELLPIVKKDIEAAQRNVHITGRARAKALEQARRPGWTTLTEEQAKALGKKPGETIQEALVMHPGFMGRIFPEPLAKELNEKLSDQAFSWLRTAEKISGVSRLAVAALDFSAPFIHGLPVLGRDPAAWAKATALHYKFFFKKPDELAKWMARPENAKALEDMTFHGSNVQTSEFVEALGKVSEKIPTKGKGFLEQTYGRAERAFTGYSIAARVEMWKGLSPFVPRAEWTELARILDRMTGTMSTKALGLGANMRAFEGGFVFFAPRYTRAVFALMGDVFKGGIAGSEARKALGGLAAGGTIFYLGVCKALGQEADLDPRSANFMTIEIGGRNIGIGGTIYGVTRLLGNLAAAGIDVAEGEKSAWDIVKPFEDGGLNRWDNPFIRFLFGKSAPLTSGIVSVIEQENYFGEPFESPADWARFMASKTMPIWLQEVSGVDTGEPALHPGIVGAEIGGMRTFPRSEWERIKDLREQYSQSEYGKAWSDLNKLEQKQIDEGYEDIKELRGEWEERLLQRGDTEANYWHERNVVRERYEDDLADAQRGVDAGMVSLSDFRKRVQGLGAEYGSTLDYVNARSEYKSVVDKLGEKYEPEYVGDIAYDDYTALMYGEPLTDQYGNYDHEERRRREARFKGKWGDEIYVYVQERLRVGKDEPALMFEYRKVQEMTRPYWEVKSRLIALARDPDLKELDELATQIGKRDPQEEQRLRRETPTLAKLQRMIEMIHKGMRLRNPELDEILNTWYAW